MYLGKKIMFKTEVVEDSISKENSIDDAGYHLSRTHINDKGLYVRSLMSDIFDEDKDNKLDYSNLIKNGLNGYIRSGIILDNNVKLKEYIEVDVDVSVQGNVRFPFVFKLRRIN